MNPRFSLPPVDIVASGILPSHPLDFRVDCLVGDYEWGFVQFQCPVILRDRHGCRERPAGTCIIYEPRASRYYHAANGPLLHTWFLAKGDGVAACLARYGLPIEEAIPLGDLPFLEPYITMIRHERIQRQAFWQDAITDLSYEFFRRLGALYVANAENMPPGRRKLSARLKDIRRHIHEEIARDWSIAEMAATANMNPTRFAMDFSKEFGVSPMNDLINARLRHARRLLTHSSSPLKQIAFECGFANVEHFIRIFHKRIGISPGQLRKDPGIAVE